MEILRLPNGLDVDFYTISEKKPDNGMEVIYFVNYTNYAEHNCVICYFGEYKTFKTVPGRFVNENTGSWPEKEILCWAKAIIKD
jgi:hypothetical protein